VDGHMTPAERILVYPKEEFAARAAAVIAEEIREAAEVRGRCSLMLAGGSTPRPVYAELSRSPLIPWEDVDIYFGDERGVGPDHPKSNYGSARQWLLQHARISALNVHRMQGERPDLNRAAREYQSLLPARIDVLLLGIGVDGHVASIFPLSPALDAGDDRVRAVRAPVSREGRITITPKVIREARTVTVLARGSLKASAIERTLASDTPVERCPARMLRGATWLLDEEAARRIDVTATAREALR